MPVYCIKHRKLLMEYDMMRTDLRHATGMSLSAFTRFSRGDYVALVVIDIISQKLQCDVSDIMDVILDEKPEEYVRRSYKTRNNRRGWARQKEFCE